MAVTPSNRNDYQTEWIPQIQIGNNIYQDYPIIELSREKADHILANTTGSLLLRTSESSRQANPSLYYVVSCRTHLRNEPIHLIVTREVHQECGGVLDRLLPNSVRGDRLWINRKSPFFMRTVETSASSSSSSSDSDSTSTVDTITGIKRTYSQSITPDK